MVMKVYQDPQNWFHNYFWVSSRSLENLDPFLKEDFLEEDPSEFLPQHHNNANELDVTSPMEREKKESRIFVYFLYIHL